MQNEDHLYQCDVEKYCRCSSDKNLFAGTVKTTIGNQIGIDITAGKTSKIRLTRKYDWPINTRLLGLNISNKS